MTLTELNYEAVEVGTELPAYTTASISRTTLALYAGASGDHNPMHIDIDFAKQSGMPDVFVHGMLNMAYLGRLLTNWVPQSAIRQYKVRFAAITAVGDKINCYGKVVEKIERDGENLVRLELVAQNQDGDVKLNGQALVTLP